MSSENITQALTNLRTAIDTKIDETLVGPKTVDQMITAVNTITTGGGGGETEETPKLCLLYLPCEKYNANADVLKENEFVFGSMRYARVLPILTDSYSSEIFETVYEVEWVETNAPMSAANYVYNLKGQPEEGYEWGIYRVLPIPLGAKFILNDFTVDFFIRKNFTYTDEMMILSFESDSNRYSLMFIGPNKIKLTLYNDAGQKIETIGEIDSTIFNDDSFIYLRFERYGNKFSVYTTANPVASYEGVLYGIPESEIVKFIDVECPITKVQERATSKAYFGDFARFCDWYLNKIRIYNYSITNNPMPMKNDVSRDCYLNLIQETR